MKTLFESILNNHIILFETKVNAKRHFTNEEAKEISTIKNIEVDPWQEDAILAKKIATYTSNRLGRVGAYAFYGCMSLTEINLPYIKTIDIHAFDKDEFAEEIFTALCPELMSDKYNGVSIPGESEYSIHIHSGVDVRTKTFADYMASLSKTTFVFVLYNCF